MTSQIYANSVFFRNRLFSRIFYHPVQSGHDYSVKYPLQQLSIPGVSKSAGQRLLRPAGNFRYTRAGPDPVKQLKDFR
ncbi:MAG: hypothetical protein KDI47_15630 [Gammaproteobacteria bacterium]|nr:hypothetical protein [Gammaproteobacteria bacterium]MCB1863141.1 hypothetical protein [Gammaproteobacteria bacterium]MCB1881855.1 hypothetical protein [Gammaproteobacteria bacterium]MCB1904615.1 hypothetical protein [Gammaproteobacteria bacterium]